VGSEVAGCSDRRSPGIGRAIRALLVAALALTGMLLVVPEQATAAGSGQVFVIHGLVGQVFDVFVDGKNVCPTAKVKTLVGPLSLAAGAHKVELRDGSKVIASSSIKVAAGSSTDVVVHSLAEAGGPPQFTAFNNDLSSVAPGKARLAVAHTAAAPPADIRVDGKVLFSNVANGEGLTLTVPAKTYSVDIVPSATASAAILGPVALPVKAGTLTRVFAIGDVSKKTMDAVVHVLPVRQVGAGAPNRVATGDGGQAAAGVGSGASRLPLTGAVALLAGLLLALAWSRRSRAVKVQASVRRGAERVIRG
jgi:Domain of unknown function (DUF4397)